MFRHSFGTRGPALNNLYLYLYLYLDFYIDDKNLLYLLKTGQVFAVTFDIIDANHEDQTVCENSTLTISWANTLDPHSTVEQVTWLYRDGTGRDKIIANYNHDTFLSAEERITSVSRTFNVSETLNTCITVK